MTKRQRFFTAKVSSDSLESKHRLGDLEQFGISPRLVTILDAWNDLPPHVQETMTLLSELRSLRPYDSKTQCCKPQVTARCLVGRLCSLRHEIIHALRHAPECYDLVMDSEGWVSVEGVLALFQATISNVTEIGIADIIAPLGDRLEFDGNRIRATYGHSTSFFAPQVSTIPDVPLFHGTLHDNWSMIELFGLQPMKRRFVQLTTDYDYASDLLRSKGSDPLVLQVMTRAAMESGVEFFHSGTHVWLTPHVPSDCLQIWGDSTTADTLGLFDKDGIDD